MSDVARDTLELANVYDRVSKAQFLLGCRLINSMGIKEGDVVLDVGCGTGRLTLSVSERGGPSGRVIGLDPSPQRIQVAERRLRDHSQTNLQFRVGAGEDLSAFSDATFDGVYFSSVFHWITDKERALAEVYRVLKPGGEVGITTPARDGRFTLGDITVEVMNGPPYAGHIKEGQGASKRVTNAEMTELLSLTGFQNISVEIKLRKGFHQSPHRLVEFYEASSFGNFLNYIPEDLRDGLKRDIEQELERRGTPFGIALASNTCSRLPRSRRNH